MSAPEHATHAAHALTDTSIEQNTCRRFTIRTNLIPRLAVRQAEFDPHA
jgi:hypothetical protein